MIIDLHTLDRIIFRAQQRLSERDGPFTDSGELGAVAWAAVSIAYDERRKSIAEELEQVNA